MTPETRQTTILGDPTDREITIKTSVGVMEPWLSTINQLVDEGRFHVNDDGLSITAVDPANVGMISTELHADGLDTYDVNGNADEAVGLNVKRLWEILQDISHDSQIRLTVDGRHLYVRVHSQYDTTEVIRETEMGTIDPDSVREDPEVPEIDNDYRAEFDVQAFKDTIMQVDTVTDHVGFREEDGHLVVYGEGDTDKVTADFGPIADPAIDSPEAGAWSLFSLDYVKDMARGVSGAKVGQVEFSWGDHFPFHLLFSRSVDDASVYSGRYMLAPRIQSD